MTSEPIRRSTHEFILKKRAKIVRLLLEKFRKSLDAVVRQALS